MDRYGTDVSGQTGPLIRGGVWPRGTGEDLRSRCDEYRPLSFIPSRVTVRPRAFKHGSLGFTAKQLCFCILRSISKRKHHPNSSVTSDTVPAPLFSPPSRALSPIVAACLLLQSATFHTHSVWAPCSSQFRSPPTRPTPISTALPSGRSPIQPSSHHGRYGLRPMHTTTRTTQAPVSAEAALPGSHVFHPGCVSCPRRPKPSHAYRSSTSPPLPRMCTTKPLESLGAWLARTTLGLCLPSY